MRTRLVLSLCCWLALARGPTPPAHASEPIHLRLKATLSYHYSSGKYGADETTDISYVPLTVKGEIDAWSLKLTVPYLQITGPPGVIEGPNGPVATDGKGDGLGDIILRGSYTVFPLRVWMPFVEIIGRVKFPTADENDGLGTGEFDYTAGLDLARTIGKLTPFLTVGYRFMGDPPGSDLDNVVLASVGSLYSIADPLTAGLFLDFRQAASNSSDDLLDVTPYLGLKITKHWSTSVYATAGILEGSPDVGVGVQLTYTYAP